MIKGTEGKKKKERTGKGKGKEKERKDSETIEGTVLDKRA